MKRPNWRRGRRRARDLRRLRDNIERLEIALGIIPDPYEGRLQPPRTETVKR